MFITAKFFHKLETEIENHLSFSFLELLVGPRTMSPQWRTAVIHPQGDPRLEAHADLRRVMSPKGRPGSPSDVRGP